MEIPACCFLHAVGSIYSTGDKTVLRIYVGIIDVFLLCTFQLFTNYIK